MKAARTAATLISLLLVSGAVLPSSAHASVLSDIFSAIVGTATANADSRTAGGAPNLQTMPLAESARNIDPTAGTGGGSITIIDGSAVVPEEGPAGTIADIKKPANGTISIYVVQPGDTLSGIAQLFGVTVSTIRWANDISLKGTIRPGQKLVILPIPGVYYTVRRGDTLASIAKRYGSNVADIASYNGIASKDLAVGSQIIIPDGEMPASSAPSASSRSSVPSSKAVPSSKVLTGDHATCGKVIPDARNPREPSHNVGPVGTCAEIGYYIAPLAHYVQTQGIHGYNAVDLAAPLGTPIMAAAAGEVIVARSAGWNGGYGRYVVIQHGNGSQTLYAHMSRVAAYDGEHVAQGQVIGYVGESGEATGPHVHFEIRNGIRNPF